MAKVKPMSYKDEFVSLCDVMQRNNFARYVCRERIGALESEVAEWNGYLSQKRKEISLEVEEKRNEQRKRLLQLSRLKNILAELVQEASLSEQKLNSIL